MREATFARCSSGVSLIDAVLVTVSVSVVVVAVVVVTVGAGAGAVDEHPTRPAASRSVGRIRVRLTWRTLTVCPTAG